MIPAPTFQERGDGAASLFADATRTVSTRAFLTPQSQNALRDPGRHRRMSARRPGHSPASRAGNGPLEIFQNCFCVLRMLGAPLRLRQHDPLELGRRTLLQRREQEWLNVTHEPGFGGGQAEPLPDQTHQTIALGPRGGVAVAARGKDQAGALRRGCSQRLGYLTGKAIHQQRVSRINIVMVDRDIGMPPPGFRESLADALAIENVQIQGDGQHESFSCAFDSIGDGFIHRRQQQFRLETQNGSQRRGHVAQLDLGQLPRWMVRL